MHTRRSFTKWAVLIGALGVLSITSFLAVHTDGLFELGDGFGTSGSADILGSPEQEGCDWADLFDADPTDEEIAAAVEACGGVDAAFVQDQLSQGSAKDDTVFTKGSSKNNDPVSSWKWTTGSSPALKPDQWASTGRNL